MSSSISKSKIDNLILNYFIQEGYQDAAVSFAKEINVELEKQKLVQRDTDKNSFMKSLHKINFINEDEFASLVDGYDEDSNDYEGPIFSTNSKIISGYSTINERREIKFLILKGYITEAIKKISEYFPTVLDSNNLLHFKLLRLSLIEMIRNHKLNTMTDEDTEKKFLNEILTFVRENLINKVMASTKLLKDLETTMSLLCFNFDPETKNIEDQKDLPREVQGLFDLSLRTQCYRLVNQAILDLKFNEELDETYFKIGALDSSRSSNMEEFLINKDLDFENNEGIDMQNELVEPVSYDHGIDYSKNLVKLATNQQSEILNEEQGDVSEYEEAALESKLEKIVKLWAITEQRLLDLNITKEKKIQLNEECL